MTSETPHRAASPPAGVPPRRIPAIAIALGVVVLLAAVAIIARGSDEPVAGSEARHASTPGSQPAPAGGDLDGPGGAGKAGKQAGKGARFNSTVCWEELERFNETVTLQTFRTWATPLLGSNDLLVREYLKERLGELIGNDAARAGEVLGWAREASPAEFKLLMGGLRSSEAILLPQVGAQLVAQGLDEHLEVGRRAGFLDELQSLRQLDAATLDKLATFAKDPASGEAAWVTTRAMGRVMKEDLTRTGTFKPYLDKLLTLSTGSLEEPVRYLALEMAMNADVPIDARATSELAKILATEGSGEVRQIAAHTLSMSEDKAQALRIYAQAFTTEKDLCVRWALFRFAARAAGKDALPVMADMATVDPRFQGDYHDFERLYASGIVDFDRIWFGLPSQDPHGCLDHGHDG